MCVTTQYYFRRNAEAKLNYIPAGCFDINGTVITGSWRNDPQPRETLLPLRHMPRKSLENAKAIRDEFSEYVMSDVGQVPWQLQYA